MNELQIFSNPEFGPVRALTIDGEPWAVGKDVAAALGYKDPAKAISVHVDAEDKGVGDSPTPGGKQTVTIINESGLYSLILSSKLPTAKRFKRWVTSEVLPALRRTGRYEMPTPETEQPLLPGLVPSDYIRAASILATCQRGRLPSVITMLERSGLDMSGIREQATPNAAGADPEEAQKITDFVNRWVPSDWMQWSIERRRQFWAGACPVDTGSLVPRDRISAIEVWCELYGKPPKDFAQAGRSINAVLRALPGWRPRVCRVGSGYGTVRGFVFEGA